MEEILNVLFCQVLSNLGSSDKSSDIKLHDHEVYRVSEAVIKVAKSYVLYPGT